VPVEIPYIPYHLVQEVLYRVSHTPVFTFDKEGGKCVCLRLSVCLSVCLLARLLKNACMDLDEMLRVDRRQDMDELINF